MDNLEAPIFQGLRPFSRDCLLRFSELHQRFPGFPAVLLVKLAEKAGEPCELGLFSNLEQFTAGIPYVGKVPPQRRAS